MLDSTKVALTEAAPTVTVAPDSNPLPRIVTEVPPEVDPVDGLKYPIESGVLER